MRMKRLVAAILAVLVANGYLTKTAWQNVWLGIKVIVADSANAIIGVVQSMIDFIISGVNSAISAINKVIAAAQKVPGVGKFLSTINEISPVTLGTINTDLIASTDLAGRSTTPQQNVVNVTGNVLLDKNVASDIGDLIIGKLKYSNAL